MQKLVATGFLRMAADGTVSEGPFQEPGRGGHDQDRSSACGFFGWFCPVSRPSLDPISRSIITDPGGLRAGVRLEVVAEPQPTRVSLYTDAQRRAGGGPERVDVVNKEKTAKQQKYIQEALEKEYARTTSRCGGKCGKPRRLPAANRPTSRRRF
ncbi:MAG: hypothetical protein Ct9H300mP1_06070 [Planctomycetaceae bacterium]|nr:MAG: hypothetical protein Ct9H300mP1_06070 [Planctomycetaceae bacterium]